MNLPKKEIDVSIATYCEKLLADTQTQFGPYSFDAIQTYCSLLNRGGKRLRGSLVMAMYKMVGGADIAMITEAARIIEMLNTNLLIFDDVADLSATRRGGPTVHKMFEQYHNKAQLFGDSEHYGVAMALHVALAGTYLVECEIDKLDAPQPARTAASAHLHQAIVTTVNGQFNDITNQVVRIVNEKQVERTLTWKSAYYTFLQPMQFGMLLAESADFDVPAVRDYAMNLGLSFQIIDDILGTFGEEDKSGKSTTDDLCEGKVTVLVAQALQNAGVEQKKALLAALGNKNLTASQFEACKKIMTDTGALDYAQKLAKTHADAAVKALESAPVHWSAEGVAFLRELAGYVTSRRA